MIFEAGIAIDGTNITDQGRKSITASRDERSVIVERANGTRVKYVKKIARTFTVSWEYLPGAATNTIDGGVGREWLYLNVADEGSTHTITFRHHASANETITAFVTDYSEELVMRRPQDFFWNVSLTLEEQ